MGKKCISLVAIILLLALSHKNYAIAQEIEKEELNIVFLVDHSGSMNSWDGQGILHEIIKAFVDTMQTGDMQIGYVAYNDRIVVSSAPVSVKAQEQRRELKESIDSISYGGETDIGLGLLEASSLFEGCHGRKCIVLISDGETDLENSDTGRTIEDSDRDLQAAVQKCAEEGIQTTTISLNEKTAAYVQGLESIAHQTGGAHVSIQEPDELFPVLCSLFCSGFEYNISEVSNSHYDEGIQTVSYENTGNSDELAVLLLSDKDIMEASIQYGSQGKNIHDIKLEPAGKYAAAMLNESDGNFNITFHTVQKQKIAIFIIGRHDISPILEWEGEPNKNVMLDFRISFLDKSGETVRNIAYDIGWHGEFENLQTGERVETEITGNEQNLSGTILFPRAGSYALYLSPQGEGRSFYKITGIDVLNTLPNSTMSQEIELLTISGEQEIRLDDIFSDSDGDGLTFELQDVPEKIIKAQIDGNELNIEPVGRGKGEIKLLISDGEGSLTESIPVRVKSLPEAYWQVLAGLFCIALFYIIKIWRRRKKGTSSKEQPAEKAECAFTGKLNAYFTLLPGEREEIPPLTFALYPVKEKKIVLENMFSNYPDLIDLLGLDSIYLFPEEGRKMILYHDCDSSIMIGNSIVCRSMQYIVSYGNVIYITSKDGTCELEVHYISMI